MGVLVIRVELEVVDVDPIAVVTGSVDDLKKEVVYMIHRVLL